MKDLLRVDCGIATGASAWETAPLWHDFPRHRANYRQPRRDRQADLPPDPHARLSALGPCIPRPLLIEGDNRSGHSSSEYRQGDPV